MLEETSEFALSDSLKIQDDHLVNVCKYRQKGCCRYIIFFEKEGDFYCSKNVPELREIVESKDMVAKGDNCEGL